MIDLFSIIVTLAFMIGGGIFAVLVILLMTEWRDKE